MDNRRQFTRILFSIQASLVIENKHYPISIFDISLNGALVTRPENAIGLHGKSGRLQFSLLDGDSEVSMEVTVVHEEENVVGLHCDTVDIDSITHIRRLVELNLGDETQLNKELSQLTTFQEN